MNLEYMKFNLSEALEQITITLEDLNSRENCNEADLRTGFEHMYHHINFAWNTRNTTQDEVNEQLNEKFYRWRQFPKDIDLSRP